MDGSGRPDSAWRILHNKITVWVRIFVALHVAAMRNEIMRRRVRTLMMLQAGARMGP